VKKSNKYGIVGSFLFCGILLILLLFIYLPGLKKPEDEGLMISFGETEEGSGMTQTPAPKPVEVPVSAPPKPVKPVKQDLMTQTDNSLAIAEQKKKDEQRKEQQIIERQRLENERIQAEKKRKQQEAIDKANSMNGMFGNNNSSGSGTSTADTQQGNPVGKGSSGGNSWSLNGRNLSGRLVSPSYNEDVEGRITVNIRVDQSGRVTSASIGSPTNISDSQTRNAAITAAQNTRFSSGKDVSSGSITYNFKLK
jgi:TonB family protein